MTKVYGQNIPTFDLSDFIESAQLPTRFKATVTNLYYQKIYNQTKYSTNFFVKKRLPFFSFTKKGYGERP